MNIFFKNQSGSVIKITLLLSIAGFCILFLGRVYLNPVRVFAAGQNTISGEVTQDTVWTQSLSPYVVSGMVIVDKGATLTIRPGTVVKFSQNAGITVNGRLIATSTQAEPIYFTSLADDKIAGDTNKDKSASVPSATDQWNIEFINASPSFISNAVIRYSAEGIFILNSSVSLASTSFSAMNGQISSDQGTLSIQNSSFSTMNRGAISIFGTSTAHISSTTIEKSATDAIDVFSNSTLLGSGISITDEEKGAGLSVFNFSDASCDHCTFSGITNNSGPSVSVFSASKLSLTNSIIKNATGTDPISLELFDPSGSSFPEDQHSQALLSNTTIQASTGTILGVGNGIQAFGPVSLNAAAVTVKGFGNDGVTAYDNATINFTTSTITKNKNAGIEVYGPVQGSIVDSTISDNGQYGITSRTDNPFIASNNWWGVASGPYHESFNPKGKGNPVSDDVTFSPWLKSEDVRVNPDPSQIGDSSESGSSLSSAPKPCCSNVLFLPGIEASRLYIRDASGNDTQLWEPNDPLSAQSNIKDLFLDASGNSVYPVYTKDIINQVDFSLFNLSLYQADIYKGFSDSLNSLVASGTIAAWQSYPYDWRLDPTQLVQSGTLLANTISKIIPALESLASTSKTHQVTIVAHSNGGIVAKVLMQELQNEGREDLVDKLILVAVPQLGTPIAIPALLSGYGQSIGLGFILSSVNAQLLAENMSTSYTLLPSSAYFAKLNSPVLFDQSLNSVSNLYKVYGSSINDATSFKNFLLGVKDERPAGQSLLAISNSALLAQATKLHNSLDLWQSPTSVQTFQIAGTGVDTLSATRYYARNLSCIDLPCQSTYSLDMEPVMTTNGDSTVVSPSATAMPVTASTTTLYVNLRSYNTVSNQNRSHIDILEALPTQQAIEDIIENNSGSLPQFVSTTSPTATDDEQIGIHSPVDINIYDNQNHHTGPIVTAVGSSTVALVQTQIPNSYYLPFGEGVYIGVPNGTVGDVVLSGTAVGTFTLDIKANGTTTEFANIPILPVSTATISLASKNPTLSVDFDGDGTVDTSFSPVSGFDPVSYLKSMKKIISTFSVPAPVKNTLKDRIDRIIAAFKADKTVTAQKIIVRYMKRPYTPRNPSLIGVLSTGDQNTIISMLGQLLNGLENPSSSPTLAPN